MSDIAILLSTTSHGGTWIAGSTVTKTTLAFILRDGDLHVCPISGHGTTPITATALYAKDTDGKKVAKVGDTVGCGATILTGDPGVHVS